MPCHLLYNWECKNTARWMTYCKYFVCLLMLRLQLQIYQHWHTPYLYKMRRSYLLIISLVFEHTHTHNRRGAAFIPESLRILRGGRWSRAQWRGRRVVMATRSAVPTESEGDGGILAWNPHRPRRRLTTGLPRHILVRKTRLCINSLSLLAAALTNTGVNLRLGSTVRVW